MEANRPKVPRTRRKPYDETDAGPVNREWRDIPIDVDNESTIVGVVSYHGRPTSIVVGESQTGPGSGMGGPTSPKSPCQSYAIIPSILGGPRSSISTSILHQKGGGEPDSVSRSFRGYDEQDGYGRDHDPEEMRELQQVRLDIYQHGHEKSKVSKPNFNADLSFTYLNIFLTIFSMITYIVDVGSDIWLAIVYWNGGNRYWFTLTLLFVIVPALTMSIFSLKWYIADIRHEKKRGSNSSLRWIPRVFFLFLQIAPILRYVDTLRFGWRSRKHTEKERREQWLDLMVYEDTDSAMLRLLECFMEAAPQLVLQIYIMTQIGNKQGYLLLVGQSVAIITSLGSLSWALTSYNRALRLSLRDKANMKYRSMIVHFLWHYFTIASRILAISMFASVFKYWIFVFIGCHFIAMLFWILYQNSNYCDNRIEEFFFNVVSAIVYIFCYFNLLEGHTRLRYLIFYIIVFLENTGLIVGWYMATQTIYLWYHYPAIAGVFGGFFLGLILQVIYYMNCHPNNFPPVPTFKKIKWVVPCSELRESLQRRNSHHSSHSNLTQQQAQLLETGSTREHKDPNTRKEQDKVKLKDFDGIKHMRYLDKRYKQSNGQSNVNLYDPNSTSQSSRDKNLSRIKPENNRRTIDFSPNGHQHIDSSQPQRTNVMLPAESSDKRQLPPSSKRQNLDAESSDKRQSPPSTKRHNLDAESSDKRQSPASSRRQILESSPNCSDTDTEVTPLSRNIPKREASFSHTVTSV